MNETDGIRRPLPPQLVKFMYQLCWDIRSRYLAYKTEKIDCFWIKRYIKYHRMQHPKEMGAFEVEKFRHHFAVIDNVSTQKIATCFHTLSDIISPLFEHNRPAE